MFKVHEDRRALHFADTGNEVRDPLLQSPDCRSQPPIAESTSLERTRDGPGKRTSESADQQQRSADAAAERAAAQKQRVRAYGLVRACGSLGYIVTSGGAAIVTRVLVPNAPFTRTFIFSVAVGDLLWLVASGSFFFFRTECISASPNLLHDIGKFVRTRASWRSSHSFSSKQYSSESFGETFSCVQMHKYHFVTVIIMLENDSLHSIMFSCRFFKQIGGTSTTFYTSLLTFTLSELVVVSCFSHLLIARLGFGGAQLWYSGPMWCVMSATLWSPPFGGTCRLTCCRALLSVCKACVWQAKWRPSLHRRCSPVLRASRRACITDSDSAQDIYSAESDFKYSGHAFSSGAGLLFRHSHWPHSGVFIFGISCINVIQKLNSSIQHNELWISLQF